VSSFQDAKGDTKGTKWPHLVIVSKTDGKRYAYGFTSTGFRLHRYAVPVVKVYKKQTSVQEM
jgi:hypothetical protein